jgi:putative ABC transport system permease protein
VLLRIFIKSVIYGRRRAAVAMMSLIVGAAAASAMLSVYYDAKQKMSRELRAYGANIMLAPLEEDGFIEQSTVERIGARWAADIVGAAPYLYVVATARSGARQAQVVLAGTWFDQVKKTSPWWEVRGRWIESRADNSNCIIGAKVALELGLRQGDAIELSSARSPSSSRTFTVAGIVTTGSFEEDQVFASLGAVGELSGLAGQASAVAVSAVGNVERIEALSNQIGAELGVRARPVRQITESEGSVLKKLRLMMLLLVALILAGASLSVATTLLAATIERRREIGLMKAIGAEEADLLRLFLCELGAMGLAGGMIGYAIGLALAQPIGRNLFGSYVAPRPAAAAAVIAMGLAVALISGLVPIRKIREIEPAAILRGD